MPERIVVPPVDVVVQRWVTGCERNRDRYEEGVKNPKRDWKTQTLNAKNAYYQALDLIRQNRTWEKGVQAVDTAYWQSRTLELGVPRWLPGVQASQGKYANKMQRVLSILQSIQLPDRGPRGDPRNLERVRVIDEALHKAKVEGRI